jgi:hypothetical protein
VTIRNGVRSNGDAAPPAVGAILALGDSFVFGDQVSDHETWPAILERLSGHRVVNGGVSGYGTAQALLHGTQLLSTAPYSLVILSILVDADLVRDRIAYVQPRVRRPIVIRDGDGIRQTTAQEQNAIGSSLCDNQWITGLLFWSQIAKRFLSELDRCRINDPRAATVEDIIEYVVAQLAALPMKKMILLQYGHVDGTMPDQATKIREAANRHGVPVIDTRAALMREPHQKIYKGSHHSMRGNEIIARVIAGELEQ